MRGTTTGVACAMALLTGVAVAVPSVGADGPTCDGLTPTVVGTAGDDVLVGTPGPDVIWAGDGNDTITAGDGNDVVCEGHGDDVVDAGPGDDRIVAEPGSDDIFIGAEGIDALDFHLADGAISLDLDLLGVEQSVNARGDTITLDDAFEHLVFPDDGGLVFVRPLAGDRSLTGTLGSVVYDAGGVDVVLDGDTLDHPTLGDVEILGPDPFVVNVPPVIIDDGDPGFTGPGFIETSGDPPQGYDDTIRYSGSGWGNTATWTFDGLAPGRYAVASTWTHAPDRADDVVFEIFVDGELVRRQLSQEVAPQTFTASGHEWEHLALVDVHDDQLVVTLTDDANEFVIADAVLVQPYAPPILGVPDRPVPAWLPDPADIGIDVPPAADGVTLDRQPGRLVIDGVVPLVPDDQPPAIEIVAVLEPDGLLARGPTFPLEFELEDDTVIRRIDLAVSNGVVEGVSHVLANVTTLCVTDLSDVLDNHPFCPEIDGLEELGIVNGYADGEFKSTRLITRQAIAAWIARMLGYLGWAAPTPCVAPPFVDIPIDHPFCPEITLGKDAGIIGGWPDGTFRPAEPVTRQANGAWWPRIHRALGMPDPPPCEEPPFPDVPVNSPFCDEIQWLEHEGISTGFADGTFRPAGNITRQAAGAQGFKALLWEGTELP